jgi:hypothetical protein
MKNREEQSTPKRRKFPYQASRFQLPCCVTLADLALPDPLTICDTRPAAIFLRGNAMCRNESNRSTSSPHVAAGMTLQQRVLHQSLPKMPVSTDRYDNTFPQPCNDKPIWLQGCASDHNLASKKCKPGRALYE